MTTAAEFDALLRSQFHLFVAKTFGTLNPSTELLDNWSVEALTWQMEQVRQGKVRRLIVNVPPRSLKTLVTSIAFPAFVLGHDPGAKILCVSHSGDLAKRFSRDFRRVVESDWYRRVFPRTIFQKTSEDMLETSAGGSRRATSIEAGVTGHGGSIILIDDPLDASDANSPVAREKVIKVYKESLIQRLDNKEHGKIVLVMQRLHEADLSGFLCEHGFEQLVMPAIATADEEVELWNGRIHRRRAGELLHPAQNLKLSWTTCEA